MTEKAAILLMGINGIGKGTQAFRLNKHLPNFVHFDTGHEIKRRVDDPNFADNPKVKEQREAYYRGDPNDTVWVADLVCERIRAIADQGKGIILSGSPRKLYEAQRVGPLLLELFGSRVLIIKLNGTGKTARERMLNRLVCTNSLCGFSARKSDPPESCPECGTADFAPKALDSEQMITYRIGWYHTQTIPALLHLYLLGVPIEDVDGEGEEEEVFGQVLHSFDKCLGLP